MHSENERHLVIFRLGREEYAVDISLVREIIKPAQVVRIPGSPEFVEGVIHLRQDIIPVIDLLRRLNIPDSGAVPAKKKIIIFELPNLIGVLVDTVGEVLKARGENIHPLPETASTIDTKYLEGVIRSGSRIILLMDVRKILSSQELRQLAGQP